MINLQVSDERTLHQAISAKVNNLQVTDQAFDICKEAIDKTNSAQQRPAIVDNEPSTTYTGA